MNKRYNMVAKAIKNNSIARVIRSIMREVEKECVSWGELAYLQEHHYEIRKYFTGDVRLYEAAGIPESVYWDDCGLYRRVE